MSRLVRWGVLGTGLIASIFTRDVGLLDAAEVAAVASRRPGGAEGFAREYGVARTFDSYEALVADPDIDLVYVAVPHTEHFAAALLAIRAGKGVLVEKPFTVTAAQAEALVAEATARGVFLMEAHWTRFLPHMVELRRLVEAGEIGEITTVFSDHGIRFDPAHEEHRLYDPALGGGALLDLGVYSVGFVVSFLGDELEVKAIGTTTRTGVDAEASAVIRDENGRHGVITTSLSAELSNRAFVAGTRGRIEVGRYFMGPSDLDVVLLGDGNPATGATARVVDGAIEGQGLRFQAIEAARCFRAGELESPIMPHALSIKIMRVMDEIRRQIGVSYAADADA